MSTDATTAERVGRGDGGGVVGGTSGGVVSRMARSLAGVRRVGVAYARLYSRSCSASRRDLVLAVVLGIAGGVGQGALAPLVGTAVHRIQAVAKSETGSMPFTLTWTGLLILAVTGLGAWAAYAAALRARRVARGLQIHQIDSIIAELKQTDAVDHPGMPAKVGELNRLAMRDSMQAASALEMLLVVIEPIMRVVFSVAVLVWFGPVMSLIVLPAFLVLGPLVYKLVWKIGQDSRVFYEEHIVRMWGSVAGQISRADSVRLGGPLPGLPAGSRPAGLEITPEIATFLDENDRMQLAQNRVQFAVAVLFSFLLAAALVISGYLAVTGKLEWGPAMAFLLALVTVVRGMRVVISAVSSLGKFYPAVKRLNAFTMHREAAGGEPKERARVAWPIPLTGEDGDLLLEPGMRVGLITDADVSRVGMRRLLAPVSPGGDPSRVAGSVAMAGRSFVANAAMANGALGHVGPARCRKLFEELGVLEEFEGLVADSGADWPAASRPLTMALACVVLSAAEAEIAVIALPLLNAAEPDHAALAMELLDHKLVITAGAAFTMPRCCGETMILARDGERLGFGDRAWAQRMRGTLPESSGTGVEDIEM